MRRRILVLVAIAATSFAAACADQATAPTSKSVKGTSASHDCSGYETPTGECGDSL